MRNKYFSPQTIGKCLGCGDKLPDAFLDLGEMPPANAYIAPENKDKEETLYELAVSYCPGCYLVQITHRVDPEFLFGNYLYFTSFSDAFLRHAEVMAEKLIERFALDSNSLVMEIGSNDGYLLSFFQKKGIPILGIEPAENIAKVANEKGIPTMGIFFGSNSANEILRERGQADLIIGNNVLAHVPLINDFLLSVNKCLKPTGSAVFEFPYLKDLLEHTEFDTIYHEHVFYYSLSAVKILAERAGLELYEATWQGIHGGSVRVLLQKEELYDISNNAKQMLLEEETYGITDKILYDNFGEKVKKLGTKLFQLLRELKKEGKTIAAYGAAAKGNTLLNYIGIDNSVIDFVVDRSTYKQGFLLPGTRIPILHQDELLDRMPDYCLILAWNFADEILRQQDEYRKRGGKFVIPIPEILVM
ncbi:MAG: class I SAM-dependent methyltransferase [Syntrophaceae bacterium]|nr:class I SAM-dependent methyltransferase [Syntrophaceae bacterium]